jgi:nucleotide-binding universal stress UspA family protein
MILLKQILVPTDFSDASAAAVNYGVAFAQAFGARLHLLHAAVRHDLDVIVERQRALEFFLADTSTAASPAEADESARHAAQEILGKVLTEEQQRALDVEYVLRAAGIGGAYVQIVRYAKEQDVDLIIMGTHGRGFIGHMLMGSVAEKVVRHSPCPVLTVRHPEHDFVIPEDAARVVGA